MRSGEQGGSKQGCRAVTWKRDGIRQPKLARLAVTGVHRLAALNPAGLVRRNNSLQASEADSTPSLSNAGEAPGRCAAPDGNGWEGVARATGLRERRFTLRTVPVSVALGEA